MRNTPLDPPENPEVLEQFVTHFGIRYPAPARVLLRDVVGAFARLPYENLTKIIRQAECGNPADARRGPADVIAQHRMLGTGGTCFSLTAALLHLVRALGFRAEPMLADRAYGPDTHSALLVWIDDTPHLLDPGFLILKPLQLGHAAPQEIQTRFNRLLVVPQPGGDRIRLYSVENGRRTFRLTFKTTPADRAEFLSVWDQSFSWDMMRYPLLTCIRRDRQLYLQGNRLQLRSHDGVERRLIPVDTVPKLIAGEFSIHPSVTARAFELLRSRGDWGGKA